MAASAGDKPFPARLLGVLSAGVVAAVSFASRDPALDLQRFFVGLAPVSATVFVCLIGMSALFLLQRRFGFQAASGQRGRGWAVAFGLALPFMLAVTVLDLLIGYPADLNVSLPTGLYFYPAMGVLAQFSLRLLPFAVLTAVASAVLGRPLHDRGLLVCMVLAAVPEALFQGAASWRDSQLLAVCTGIQLMGFGFVELWIYRRFDFVSMVGFRLFYYAYWHLLWGALRLP